MLLLDTGDALVGGKRHGRTTPGDLTNGEVVVAAMNAMAYDAMALGPYELSLEPEALAERLASAEFAVVSANAYRTDGRRIVAPFVVRPVGDHRVAIVGLTRPPEDDVPGARVRDPRDELVRVLPDVLSQAGTVVVITNMEFEQASELLRDVPGLDLVVAARPFRLPDRAVPLAEPGALAVTAEWPSPGHTGRRVGRLAVTVTSDGELANQTWSTMNLDGTWTDDAAMTALLALFDA